MAIVLPSFSFLPSPPLSLSFIIRLASTEIAKSPTGGTWNRAASHERLSVSLSHPVARCDSRRTLYLVTSFPPSNRHWEGVMLLGLAFRGRSSRCETFSLSFHLSPSLPPSPRLPSLSRSRVENTKASLCFDSKSVGDENRANRMIHEL